MLAATAVRPRQGRHPPRQRQGAAVVRRRPHHPPDRHRGRPPRPRPRAEPTGPPQRGPRRVRPGRGPLPGRSRRCLRQPRAWPRRTAGRWRPSRSTSWRCWPRGTGSRRPPPSRRPSTTSRSWPSTDAPAERGAPPVGHGGRARRESNDLPIELNDDVLACIDLYQGPLREWFAAALERGGRYLPHIREVFAAGGRPPGPGLPGPRGERVQDGGALPRQGERRVAVHPRDRAALRPAPGLVGGRAQQPREGDPGRRPVPEASSTSCSATGTSPWRDTTAGEGRVSRALEVTGAGDYWGLRRTGRMPRETRNYVPMIHAAIVVAKAPEKYGFEIDARADPRRTTRSTSRTPSTSG